MEAARRFPFLYRPMVAAALGVAAGAAFYRTLTGTGPLWALCLFSVLGLLGWRFGLLPQRTFALALVFALLRCLLLPELSLPSWFMRPFEAAREALVATTRALFPKADASLLCAMLWGDKTGLDPALRAAYRGAGVAHILALSGLHVSFVALALNGLARKAPVRLRLGLTAALLFAYCAVAAFPASLVRATVMSLCPLLAEALGRKKDQASSIAFAALCILICAPAALFDIGFQLSFGAVAAIAMLSQPLVKALPLPPRLAEALALSLCGMVGTLPLTARHFGEVALLSLFANLLILPIVPVAFLTAMAACLCGTVYLRLGEFLAPTARLFVRGMSAAAEAVSALPFSLAETAKPGVLPCALFYGAMLALSRYCLLPAREKWALAGTLLAGALLLML